MKHSFGRTHLIVLFVAVVWVHGYGQNTRLRTSSLNMGSAASTSGNSSLRSAAGQVIIGDAQRNNTRLRSGFLSLGVVRRQGVVRIDSISGIGIERESLKVNITFPPEITQISGRLFYRRGGEDENAYASDSLMLNGNTLAATIPETHVTIRGIEYYGILRIGQTTQVFPEGRDRANPAPLRVRVSQKIRTDLNRLKYKMISLPVDTLTPLQSQVTNVLGDDYGEYRRNYWRLFRWANGGYVEHPDIPSMFIPGNAFWLVTHGGEPYDIDSGLSVNTATPYRITLPAGDWTQISNPFAFNVDWRSIVQTGSVQLPSYFNGTSYDTTSILFPWEGYFVYNNATVPVTLTVPAIEAPPQPPVARTVTGQSPPEFTLRISARSRDVPELMDTKNYLGFRAGAQDGYDALDFPDPPLPPEGGLRVSIRDGEPECMFSFKPEPERGAQWEVRVVSSEAGQWADIAIEPAGELKEGFHVFVYDEEEERVAVRDRGSIAVRTSTAGRMLKVLVGTTEYAQGMLGDIPLEPVEFALNQNYPNPFNPQTTIRYQLAKRSHVRLEIFNVLGQRISVLVDEEQRTGFHSVVWNGRNGEGIAVGSGIYLYRMIAGEFVDNKKLILVR